MWKFMLIHTRLMTLSCSQLRRKGAPGFFTSTWSSIKTSSYNCCQTSTSGQTSSLLSTSRFQQPHLYTSHYVNYLANKKTNTNSEQSSFIVTGFILQVRTLGGFTFLQATPQQSDLRYVITLQSVYIGIKSHEFDYMESY